MRRFRNATLLLAVSALAAALGCTSSPTEPKSGPVVTPKPPATQTSYNITVTANPPDIVSGGNGSSTITVDVRRTDTGQAPADGTVVALATTLGTFNSVGGPTTVNLQLVNGRASAALFGSVTDVGTATVRATLGGSTGATNVHINQAATFYVSSVQPNTGDPAGGQTVTILGGGFSQPVRVTFGGAAATVRSVTPNQIVAVTPSAAAAGAPVGVGQSASVNVTVVNNVNQPNSATDSITQGFTYASGGGGGGTPQVFAVSPSLGTNDGGTRVTITGSGFQSPVQVFFGKAGGTAGSFSGVEATVVSVTPTQIVAITPAARGFGLDLTNQLVDVIVKNVNGGFVGVGTQEFHFGAKVSVTAVQVNGPVPASGGTTMVILGQGFLDPTTVSFHFRTANVNIPQLVTQTTGTQIVIKTTQAPLPTTCPAGGIISADSITVTNVSNGDFATANVGVNFQLPLPQIASISPGSGASGVTTVTISGQDFPSAQNTAVIFGDATNGSSAQVLSSSPDGKTVTAIVPNPPTGFAFNTQPCGNGGTQKLATPINITVTDSSSGCNSTFRNGFLLAPADSSCQGQTPGTPPVASFTSAPVTGHTIQFSDTSSGTPTSWMWDFGDGTPNTDPTTMQQNPTHTYSAASGPYPKNFPVKLTVSNSAGSSQAVKVITVP
ncbi:MAG TPA: IPT/TIG domain-containing protein [Thermoanaerobaculia bacterium]|jgi:PKD repeat protein